MGRAVADAPNPLDAPPPASMSGTDDLLAQLAGDEIDRLLAEADVDRPANAPAAPAASARAPIPAARAEPVIKPAEGDDLDNLLSELNKDATAADTGPKQKTLTEQVPDVLAQLAVKPALTVGDSAARAADTPAVPAAEPEQSLDAVMSAEEREALSLSNLQAATAAAEQQDASMVAAEAKAAETVAAQPAPLVAQVAIESGPVHPAVRVLEWINKPLSFIPDAARDPIGKAAIVTIVNSIAVLIYVVFIRH